MTKHRNSDRVSISISRVSWPESLTNLQSVWASDTICRDSDQDLQYITSKERRSHESHPPKSQRAPLETCGTLADLVNKIRRSAAGLFARRMVSSILSVASRSSLTRRCRQARGDWRHLLIDPSGPPRLLFSTVDSAQAR